MGCLKLTYCEEELFLDEYPEKTEAFELGVWVNPERGFLRVDVDQASQGSPDLSSPRDFAVELAYYYTLNSNTNYRLSTDRFNDIYKQAHDNSAIDWSRAKKMSNGLYSIPVNFYKTDYDFAFGRATMTFSFDSQAGFTPVGFFDHWDLDSKPWGQRSYLNEMVTRFFNTTLDNGTPFNVVYP